MKPARHQGQKAPVKRDTPPNRAHYIALMVERKLGLTCAQRRKKNPYVYSQLLLN